MASPSEATVATMYWGLVLIIMLLVWGALAWARSQDKLTWRSIIARLAGKPALKLVFNKHDRNHWDRKSGGEGRFAHVFVQNLSGAPIRECLVECEEIEAIDFSGNKIEVTWHVALPIAWCNRHAETDPEKYKPITLPTGPKPRHAVDGVSSYLQAEDRKIDGQDVFRLHCDPQHQRGYCYVPGVYKFLLHAYSPYAKSDRMYLVVTWNGRALEIDVEAEAFAG